MKKNVFKEELIRRGKNDENAYSMIGTELKRIRTSQSKTLASVAGDLCSISYLCKVEKAQLKPNRQMLNEICKKLDLSSPTIDVIFELKSRLLEMINAFLEKNNKLMTDIYNQCKDYVNYRSKLIEFIYHISTFELDSAIVISKELIKITSEMLDDELYIFMLFYANLYFYQDNYSEALDLLNHVLESTNPNLVKIAEELIFKINYILNTPLTLFYGDRIILDSLKKVEYKKADYFRYLKCLYFLNNGLIDKLNDELMFVKDQRNRLSLELFIDASNNTLKPKTYYEKLRPMARLIYIYLFEKNNYLDEFLRINKNYYYDCDFSYNIANYLSLGDDDERMAELNDVIIPNIAFTNNAIEKQFFLKQHCRISSNLGRYKSFCKAFQLLNGIEGIE